MVASPSPAVLTFLDEHLRGLGDLKAAVSKNQ
jgi:hypothetical protein